MLIKILIIMSGLLTTTLVYANPHVNGDTKVNRLLVRYCGQTTHNSSQSVTIEKMTAIGNHRGGYLRVEQAIADQTLQLELAKRAKQVGIGSSCLEYLDEMQLMTLSKPNSKALIARVYFDFDQHALTPASVVVLNSIVNQLKGADNTIELVGNSDNIGAKKYNKTLGLQRAATTQQYLTGQGVKATQLQVSSAGETQPVKDNSTAAGRQQNRRVDIF